MCIFRPQGFQIVRHNSLPSYTLADDQRETRRWLELKSGVQSGPVHGGSRQKGESTEGVRGWLFPGLRGGEAKAFTAQGAKVSKANDWNKLRIECKGTALKTWLNGELRADLKDDRKAKGFIGLQVHGVGKDKTHEGWEVRFRNIRLQEIGP